MLAHPSSNLARLLRLIAIGSAFAVAGSSAGAEPAASDSTTPPAYFGALKSRSLAPDTTIERLAFGSCFKSQRRDDRVFHSLAAWNPQLFVFAGDTLYPDRDDSDAHLPRLRAAYAALAVNEPFATLRRSAEVLAVWDDHDYGRNDGGADFPYRAESERLFLDYWGVPATDPRARRPGIYFSRVIGPPGKRLQLIVLDTRYFRSPLRPSDARGARGRERYIPDGDPAKTLLGEAQWTWLALQLSVDVDLRLIVSSIQVLADGHGWEGWRQLPGERDRFYQLLRDADDTPLLLLSGDRHVAGFYELDIGRSSPVLEFTASALNNPVSMPHRLNTLKEAGPHRLGALYGESNFGGLQIDWKRRAVSLELYSADGERVRQETFAFGGLE